MLPIAVLQDQSGNRVNAAEILDLEILDVNARLEILLKLNNQFHKALRVKNAGIKQIGVSRGSFHMQDFGK